MYQVFIRHNGKSHPATTKGLGERSFLEYEERNDARNKATEIRLAMAYMTNAGVKHDSEVIVKEV